MHSSHKSILLSSSSRAHTWHAVSSSREEYSLSSAPCGLPSSGVAAASCRDPDGQPIGQVRFDRMRTEHDTYEISITIAPEARGRGFSLQLLAAAEDQLLQTTGFLNLRAYVDIGNKASKRLFEAGGYSIISSMETPGQWWKKEIHV